MINRKQSSPFIKQSQIVMTLKKRFLKILWKILWKKSKMLVTSLFPFPTMFSTLPKTNLSFLAILISLFANTLNLDLSQKFVIWYRID